MPDLSNPVKRDEWAKSQGFDGWDHYRDKGGSLEKAMGSGQSGSFTDRLNEQLAQVQKYADELIKESQDNFDFITKFLDKQHNIALGTDDKGLAEFYEQVSDSVEERMGRIPFDFQQRTEREKEDLQSLLQENARQKRQIESEFELRKTEDQKALTESFQARGFGPGSGIQKADEARAEERRQLALRRQVDPLEERERVSKVLSARRLTDIGTEARRGAQDFALDEEQRRERATMSLSQRLAEVRRQQASEELQVRSLEQQREELRRLNA